MFNIQRDVVGINCFESEMVLCIFCSLMLRPYNIALVHDWLVTMRGGEKVFEILCELFPAASVFTLVHKKGSGAAAIERMNIHTSLIQKLPFGLKRYQYYLPLFPLVIKQFDLSDFELVISSSHAVAKAVPTHPRALHICYCHTPMRYIWDQYEQYFGRGRANFLTRMMMKMLLPTLQRWDVKTSQNVKYFVANSKNVQERIRRIYNRDAEVLYPPVDVRRFPLSTRDDGYYLVVAALVPYKRIDLAIEAFNRLGKPLVIIGSGVEEKKLKALANKNIEFVPWLQEGELPKYYSGCRALIFPGEEDFGIVPVEAMACGKPVIAFEKGGALETVINGKTGIFFREQSTECLVQAVKSFETQTFDPQEIHRHAQQFDREVFRVRMQKFIAEKWEKHQSSLVNGK